MSIVRFAVLLLVSGCAFAQPPDGAALYAKHCARCHATSVGGWATEQDKMAHMPPQAILAQLHLGFMSAVATISPEDKQAIAAYLTGKPVEAFRMPVAPAFEGGCVDGSAAPDLLAGPRWNGWGGDLENSRFQPAAGLTASQLSRLKLKWAFAFPAAAAAWSQPTVAGGRVFAGSMNGTVYSLDARTGCTYWTYLASPAGVRAAISIGPGFGPARFVAYAGDLQANVHAIDALTGKLLWKTSLDSHPAARITGAPQLYEDRLYVPLASIEEALAGNPKYECCTFRGSVAALDARTGKLLWKTYMLPQPRPTGRNSAQTQLWGPSGAGVWSAPTVDEKRRLLYVATGDQYSDPEEGHADSVLALELASGKIAWARKLTAGDRWNVACLAVDKTGCPKTEGPDYDFGSSPILHRLPGGGRVLLAGQKSGLLHALDPDRGGAVVRQVRVAKGGLLGGIEWGPAADEARAYAATSDFDPAHPEAGGGLTAIQIVTGEKIWHVSASKPACLGRPGCSAAQPAAVTAIPGAVFSGSLDGHIRAYAAADGKLLWDFDTARPFETVNHVPGQGGSLNGAGPTVVNGMVFVNSGYGLLHGGPGNVLLAFSVEGQ